MTLMPSPDVSVAPFTGAWIEIVYRQQHHQQHQSLPSRERGLKFDEIVMVGIVFMSLPSRERGLKYFRQGHLAAAAGRSLHGSVD